MRLVLIILDLKAMRSLVAFFGFFFVANNQKDKKDTFDKNFISFILFHSYQEKWKKDSLSSVN